MRRLSSEHMQIDVAPRRIGQPAVERPAEGLAVPVVDPLAADASERERLLERVRAEARELGLADAAAEIRARVGAIEAQLRTEHEAAVAALQAETARLRSLLAAVPAAIAAQAQDAEEMAVEVAYAATTRILGMAAAERSLMSDLCRAVVEEFGRPGAILKVSGRDRDLIDEDALGIEVQADPRLAAGQCVLVTDRGQFDCGLDVRLDELRNALLAGLAEHRGRK